ncbi:unnamed protein product [Sympodiomycopsis kandeliae]
MSSSCQDRVATATLYETRTTVLPTQIVSDSTTLTSSFTTTLAVPTQTLYNTPSCVVIAPTTPTSAPGVSRPITSPSSSRQTTTQTLTSALATVNDISGSPSVVYVTYTATRSSVEPVYVTVAASAASTNDILHPSSSATQSPSSKHSSSTGVIVGSVVGAVTAILLTVILALYHLKRKRNKTSSQSLNDLFQRSNGYHTSAAQRPSRGNSHHSSIKASAPVTPDGEKQDGQEEATMTLGLPTLASAHYHQNQYGRPTSPPVPLRPTSPPVVPLNQYGRPISPSISTPPQLLRSASDNDPVRMQIRSTPSSPTLEPYSAPYSPPFAAPQHNRYSTSWYLAQQHHPMHSSYNRPKHHNRHSLANIPDFNRPSSPPPPARTPGKPLGHRASSSNLLSSQQSPPQSPSSQSFGIQPLPPPHASQSLGSRQPRTSITIDAITTNRASQWPPSRYSHLDINGGNTQEVREEEQQRPTSSFWRTNDHAQLPKEQENKKQEDDGEEEERYQKRHNLFVLNADDAESIA